MTEKNLDFTRIQTPKISRARQKKTDILTVFYFQANIYFLEFLVLYFKKKKKLLFQMCAIKSYIR